MLHDLLHTIRASMLLLPLPLHVRDEVELLDIANFNPANHSSICMHSPTGCCKINVVAKKPTFILAGHPRNYSWTPSRAAPTNANLLQQIARSLATGVSLWKENSCDQRSHSPTLCGKQQDLGKGSLGNRVIPEIVAPDR